MLRLAFFFLTLIALIAPAALASKVADLTRIKGQGEFKLRGLGLVVGLQGTGDAGKEPILARPLAKLLENEGNAPGQLAELSAAKAVAVVWVDVTIPEIGGRSDDDSLRVIAIDRLAKGHGSRCGFHRDSSGTDGQNRGIWIDSEGAAVNLGGAGVGAKCHGIIGP